MRGVVPEYRGPGLIAGRIRGISTLAVVVWICCSAVSSGADGSGTHAAGHTTRHIGSAAAIGGATAIDGAAAVGATCVNATDANGATTGACMDAAGTRATGTGAASCVGLSGHA